MATENQIILKTFLTKRADFEKYSPYVIGLKNLDRNMKLMLGFMQKFYDQYPDSVNCPESEFRIFLSAYDTFNFAQNNTQYLSDIYNVDIQNRALTLDVIESCIEKHIMAKVLDKAALVLDSNKKGVLSTVQEDIDEFHTIIRTPPKEMKVYNLDLQELIKNEVTNIGLPFTNQKPNDVIRGMRTGQLGLIYAYVNTGKTSYGVANLCSVANYLNITKSKRHAVYACNEEDVSRVTLRAIQCMTNRSDKEIEADIKGTHSLIMSKGFKHIKFIDHVTNMRIVQKILDKYTPRIMFIDQGTKVKMIGSRSEGVDALEETFGTYRDLAKLYECTIIAMAQGGEACFDKKHPDLKDIYGSKSAIQGCLDWAISIGTDSSDTRYANFRYFSITKNKGDMATYACKFDTMRCQFNEI